MVADTITTQKITSAATSINTLNTVYKLIKDKYPIASLIFDYGCGKYNTNKEYAEECGYEWIGYDPYNRSEKENKKCFSRLEQCFWHPSAIICSNVLNVLEDVNLISSVLNDIHDYANDNTDIYITIYEGDKSGVGKVTTKGYQRNEKLIKYTDYISEWFDIIETIKPNILKCKKI